MFCYPAAPVGRSDPELGGPGVYTFTSDEKASEGLKNSLTTFNSPVPADVVREVGSHDEVLFIDHIDKE